MPLKDLRKNLVKNMKNKKIPPLTYGAPRESMPVPDWTYTPDVFQNPEGLIFDPTLKHQTLIKMEEAYTQAWIQNKILEISYQRMLHGYSDMSGLVKDKLLIELSQVQNELTLCKAMLETIREWQKINK